MTAISKIDGDAKTVRALLGEKYEIDYYQREYRWERKHVETLLEDLETRFMASYEPGDTRRRVQDYSHYFLGPVVVSRKGSRHFLIDGQQRLTTLTLLLIYLNHLQSSYSTTVAVDGLIYSERYGEKSFHLDVAERRAAMQALYEYGCFAPSDGDASVANLVARYADIEDLFPDDLGDERTLPHFLDWLLENVEFVEITTYNDEDAYAIFETMNDRGLSLTPTEMLKGYLLSKLDNEAAREQADGFWRTRMNTLGELGAEEDSAFFKAWLRAQYASTIRERKRGASNRDFEHIGTHFHKWVRDRADQEMELRRSTDFERFLHDALQRAATAYYLLRTAERHETRGLEVLFFNAASGFTLQPALLLAPLTEEDGADVIERKFRVVASYIDIYVFRRVVNFRTLAYSAIQYAMFTTIRAIRRKTLPELVDVLKRRIEALDEEAPLDGILSFRLHQQNKIHVRNLLARLTVHLERASGKDASFARYVRRDLLDPFDIEHVWADKPGRHTNDFPDEHVFREYRNRLGGLLLLPRSFNRSYGDLSYAEKRPHYNAQNLLARSLCDESFHHNPGFLRYRELNGLPFEPHPTFGRADLDARQRLYRDLAAEIWDPTRLDRELDAPVQEPAAPH